MVADNSNFAVGDNHFLLYKLVKLRADKFLCNFQRNLTTNRFAFEIIRVVDQADDYTCFTLRNLNQVRLLLKIMHLPITHLSSLISTELVVTDLQRTQSTSLLLAGSLQ